MSVPRRNCGFGMAGAYFNLGNTLTDRALAVARPGFVPRSPTCVGDAGSGTERAGGMPCPSTHAPRGCCAKDAGFEQTCPQREMCPMAARSQPFGIDRML